MEKLVYAFWRGDQEPVSLRNRFIADTAPRIKSLGAQRLQLNVNDFGDMTGTIANFALASMSPPPDGIVSFWLTSAWRREPVERVLRDAFARIAGWAVAESTILPNIEHPGREGERTFGFSQVTFLQMPPRLSPAEWLRIWREGHTQVAIDTQANFRYVQNVVVMPLTTNGPPVAGIVEECFPIEGLRDLTAFYGAVGDPAEFQRRAQLMQQSCIRFIDFDRLDVIATSEYLLHSTTEPGL